MARFSSWLSAMNDRPGAARPEAPRLGPLAVTIALGIVVGYLVSAVLLFESHRWLLDAHGAPVFQDFFAIWTAGRFALLGAAASAYDGHILHSAEQAIIGHDPHGFLGWPYPPAFFFVAAPLAALPYLPAYLTWIALTLVLYALTIGDIVDERAAMLVALAAPWAFVEIVVGQNGFLTAALIGLALLHLEKRPAVSGIMLALLTYKPQFGLLFPLVLALDGRWRAFAWACAGSLVLAALSCAEFGVSSFVAFLHELPHTTQTLVVDGAVGWSKLQSVYGTARWLGASNTAGWIAQGGFMAGWAAFLAWLWRSSNAYALKAAALTVGVLLATPYVFSYDMPILSVAIAFLARDRGFDRIEWLTIGVIALAFIPAAFFAIPEGLAASIAIAALILRRTSFQPAGILYGDLNSQAA